MGRLELEAEEEYYEPKGDGWYSKVQVDSHGTLVPTAGISIFDTATETQVGFINYRTISYHNFERDVVAVGAVYKKASPNMTVAMWFKPDGVDLDVEMLANLIWLTSDKYRRSGFVGPMNQEKRIRGNSYLDMLINELHG